MILIIDLTNNFMLEAIKYFFMIFLLCLYIVLLDGTYIKVSESDNFRVSNYFSQMSINTMSCAILNFSLIIILITLNYLLSKLVKHKF